MQNILEDKLKKIELQINKIMPSEITEEWIYNTFNINKTQYKLPGNLTGFIKNISMPGVELLYSGGKRWRPLLMILCCEMCGGTEEDILQFTPIVEIVHNGTLIIENCIIRNNGVICFEFFIFHKV